MKNIAGRFIVKKKHFIGFCSFFHKNITEYIIWRITIVLKNQMMI
jgi:hypothetical protein